jgi:asparagine synthase (glutamine-hydrolysing)
MCGIAGIVNLAGDQPVPHGALRAMADALFHRGPDQDGYLEQPRLSLASRRLSIVGLKDGRQPIANEDSTIFVVYNGELFDYPEKRSVLESRGHRFATHCDTELIPHLWEDYQEGMFEHLRGQFALALWDQRQRRLILARDRFGICPLYWTSQTSPTGDWLLFASEVKGLLASGMVPAKPDPRGINHAFTFFPAALPGPVTCFQGVQALVPGHYLDIRLGTAANSPPIQERTYWEIDFPDQGEEEAGQDPQRLVDKFEELLLAAVEKRLRADVPVVSYLSGGVDSSLVVALACHIRKEPIPTFTVRIADPRLDETRQAALVARHVGAESVVVSCGAAEVVNTYPEVIQAVEGPVIDTSSAAVLLLAREVHQRGFKAALTGEGADEWLLGYPWFKVHRLLSYLDFVPGLPLSHLVRRGFLRLTGAPRFPWEYVRRVQQAVGGPNAWLDMYGLMGLSKLRFFSRSMLEATADLFPYDDLGINNDRIRRWHPMHRAVYLAGRVHLPGLLLSCKGDRVAMHSSLEARYPFLDEDVFAFLARLHPRWKLRGFRDKYLLRLLAQRWLPSSIAWRRKAMFRAPLDSFHADPPPAFVEQLLSEESLRKTGYFDPASVHYWRQQFRGMGRRSLQRLSVEMGLVCVVATQLWHHLFIDGTLADLPRWSPALRQAPASL